MARIAKGVFRYVIDAAEPFIFPITHAGDVRVNGVDEPLRTQTTAHRGEHALVTPFITKFRNGATGHPLAEPLHHYHYSISETHPGGAAPLGIVTPFLVPRYGERDGQQPRARSVEEPMPVIVPPATKRPWWRRFLVGCGGRAAKVRRVQPTSRAHRDVESRGMRGGRAYLAPIRGLDRFGRGRAGWHHYGWRRRKGGGSGGASDDDAQRRQAFQRRR